MLYDPDLKSLCASARDVRNSLLRRAAAAACCEFDEASLSKAEAAVDQVISEFLFSPETETARRLVNNNGGSTKVLDLLTMAAMTALAQACPKKPEPRLRGRRPDLRVRPTERRLELVADAGRELVQ